MDEGEANKVHLDLQKSKNDITVKFKYIDDLYRKLQEKIDRQIEEKESQCHISVAVDIHRLKEALDRTSDIFDDLLVSLDGQGLWDLSEEDIKRMEASEKASELFREFLPEMVKRSLEKDSRKDIKTGCYIQ